MNKVVSLTSLKAKEKSMVVNVEDFDEKLKFRLIELGFVKGERVSVIYNDKNRKIMVVSVRCCAFAIDYNLAGKVMVYGV